MLAAFCSMLQTCSRLLCSTVCNQRLSPPLVLETPLQEVQDFLVFQVILEVPGTNRTLNKSLYL